MSEEQIHQQALSTSVLLVSPGRMLDNNNAPVMFETLKTALSQGFKYVIVDMSRLEFLSSAGVGAILGAVKVFRDINGDIIIINASETVLHIFQMLDIADYLTVKHSWAEAAALCGITTPLPETLSPDHHH